MRTFFGATKVLMMLVSLWMSYNMFIFFEIARGKHMGYIPYLHFPIKIFVALMSFL